jgi:hypothetical protein
MLNVMRADHLRRTRITATLLMLSQCWGYPVLAAELPQHQVPIHLPLTFIRQNAVTTITVDGLTVNADVDTGGVEGASLTLSEAVIYRVGGTKLSGALVATDSFGHNSIRPRFRVRAVTIGGHSFPSMTVMQTSIPATGFRRLVPNAIGRRFLSRYFVVLNFANSSITLWPPGTRTMEGTGCGNQGLPMERTREAALPVGVFLTRYGRLRLLFDTGATYSMLPQIVAEKMDLPTIVRGPGSPRFYESTVLSVGGRNFAPLEFVILPLKPPADFQGMLGWNFFMHHVVCLDYRRREVLVR